MPTAATMTDPLPVSIPTDPWPRSPAQASAGSSTPPDIRRRRRRAAPQPTFHLNIGRVEVPRSLPQVRTIGTQTVESACREQEALDKLWPRRTAKWFGKWVMPVLRAAVAVLDWVLSRIGFGVRIR